MKPRILILDIECAPNIVFSWGLFNQNIGINQIVDAGYVMCFAAKWLGSNTVVYRSLHNDGKERMLDTAHSLLNEADIVIGYNSTKFDLPTLNKEFIKADMLPPSSYQQIDLLKVARKEFRFASNKLDYVCQFLGIGAKVNHKGFELWKECMAGVCTAWETMKEYNIQDVHITETLYHKLLPWIKNHPTVTLYLNTGELCCPSCGSDDVQKRGYHYTKTMRYQRFCCNKCGSWSKERTTDLSSEDRKLLLSAC